MLTREQRATMSAMWLGRWADGEALEFRWPSMRGARALTQMRRIDDASAAPHRPVARGGWHAEGGQSGRGEEAPGDGAIRPVAVKDTPVAAASMLMRLVLANGRRAELEIGGVASLGEVLGVLERVA